MTGTGPLHVDSREPSTPPAAGQKAGRPGTGGGTPRRPMGGLQGVRVRRAGRRGGAEPRKTVLGTGADEAHAGGFRVFGEDRESERTG